jgi:hypothetical protein
VAEETVPCSICSTDTPMLDTRLCNRCYELERRIHADPLIALRIIHTREAITQISVVQGHESGFCILALTNYGNLFFKMNGVTASGDWLEVELPSLDI